MIVVGSRFRVCDELAGGRVSVFRAELVGEKREVSNRLGDHVLDRPGDGDVVVIHPVDNKTVVPWPITTNGSPHSCNAAGLARCANLVPTRRFGKLNPPE